MVKGQKSFPGKGHRIFKDRIIKLSCVIGKTEGWEVSRGCSHKAS